VDLLTSNTEFISILKNLGDHGFLSCVAADFSHQAFEPADLDGDGDADLVVATFDQLHVFGNRGACAFEGPVSFDLTAVLSAPLELPAGHGGSGGPDPNAGASMAMTDIDGDGDLDIALASLAWNKVLVLINQTPRARPDVNRNSVPDECETPDAGVFRRADARDDGAVDVTDAVIVLRHLFVTGDPIPCLEAADANDDGRVDVSDAVSILRFLFLGTAAPPEPFVDCGRDPTPDLLGCASPPRC
jgi:hypothetical protein